MLKEWGLLTHRAIDLKEKMWWVDIDSSDHVADFRVPAQKELFQYVMRRHVVVSTEGQWICEMRYDVEDDLMR